MFIHEATYVKTGAFKVDRRTSKWKFSERVFSRLNFYLIFPLAVCLHHIRKTLRQYPWEATPFCKNICRFSDFKCSKKLFKDKRWKTFSRRRFKNFAGKKQPIGTGLLYCTSVENLKNTRKSSIIWHSLLFYFQIYTKNSTATKMLLKTDNVLEFGKTLSSFQLVNGHSITFFKTYLSSWNRRLN